MRRTDETAVSNPCHSVRPFTAELLRAWEPRLRLFTLREASIEIDLLVHRTLHALRSSYTGLTPLFLGSYLAFLGGRSVDWSLWFDVQTGLSVASCSVPRDAVQC